MLRIYYSRDNTIIDVNYRVNKRTMIRWSYRRILVIFIVISSILLLNLFQMESFSHAQSNGDPFTFSSEFKMLELGEAKGEMSNVNSILFPLPSENWNITKLELNFTGIQSKREIKDIETETIGAIPKDLYKGRKGFAVEFNIIKPTEIYATHIYGFESSPFTTINVSIQINGYDSISNRPNETIYGSEQLILSNEAEWYIQNFTFPIFLNPGSYFLVLNGTDMLPQDNGRCYWYFDNTPQNPNLHTSIWEGEWSNGSVGEPFLYKLDQKIIGQFYPEEINMTAEIDGIYYPILDGIMTGTGFLNESIDIIPSDHSIQIPFRNNSSLNLMFNASYNINLDTYNAFDGSGTINEDSINFWTLTPIVGRFFNYQFTQLFYPKSWFNINVFQKIGTKWENRTSEVYIDATVISLPNNTINDDDNWMITAHSPNEDFSINLGELEWNPGQELQFSVILPKRVGNLTFDLINPLGYGLEEPIVKEVQSEETIFTYLIPSNSREGTYIIKIYWNNNTDAGVQSIEFQLVIPPIPFTIDPIWIILSVLITVCISVLVIFSYMTIKKNRLKRAEEAQKLFNKCMDVLSLEYIIVSDKKSGLNIYQQNFSGRKIEAAMISGFLQAIHSFGIELIKIEDQSQTIKLEYKDSIIFMTEYVNLRLILIMKESPSPNFLYSLDKLAYEIYNNYGDLIENFNGNIKPFYSIEKLLRQYLNISLTYPLKLTKINIANGTKFNAAERMFISKAMSFMKKNKIDYFYLSSLLPEKACSPKDIENILNLIERNIFQLKDQKELKIKK
ncbi:MAG: hypothetical protein ACFFCV_09320 [Promethearchaeota archaeon]